MGRVEANSSPRRQSVFQERSASTVSRRILSIATHSRIGLQIYTQYSLPGSSGRFISPAMRSHQRCLQCEKPPWRNAKTRVAANSHQQSSAVRWPSGLRRQVKVTLTSKFLVLERGREFESHSYHRFSFCAFVLYRLFRFLFFSFPFFSFFFSLFFFFFWGCGCGFGFPLI